MKAKRVLSLALAAMLELSSIAGTGFTVLAAAPEDEAVLEAQEADAVEEADEATPEKASPAEADAEEEDPVAEEGPLAATDISEYLTVNDNGVITAYSYTGEDITDIIIPSIVGGKTVTGIGNDVFSGHRELISVQFPSTLTWIGNGAFKNASLGSSRRDGHLVIPASVEKIGYNAFEGCNALETVTFEEGSGKIEFDLYWGNGTTFASCQALTTINLSNRIDVLPSNFAKNCPLLHAVNWSATVKQIGASAFESDPVLDSTDLSATVIESIGDNAFNGCTGFGLAVFPETLKSIGHGAFAGTLMGKRSAAGHLVIPASVEFIGYNAFDGCVYLEQLTFNDYTGAEPTPVTFDSYWGNACTFQNCPELKTVTLSNRISSLPSKFAINCSKLSTVNWGRTVKEIGTSAFESDVLFNSYDMSSTSIETIGDNAFLGCSALELVKLPHTLKSIGHGAFNGTAMGKSESHGKLVIPSSVLSIGYNAFEACEYLESVTFESYTGEAALEPISFGTYWGNGCTFQNCKELKSITLSNRVSVIPSLFTKGCEALKTVKWSESITVIGASAFAGNTLFNSPDLSATRLTTIEDGAFSGCTSLGLVIFPETLKTIGNSAFENTAMGDRNSGGVVVISEEVTTVGHNAFAKCAYLTEVIVEDYTGDGALPVLTFGTYWGSSNAFSECPMLEEIIIGDRVKVLPEAFAKNDPELTMLTIPASVETIQQSAFYVATENGRKINTYLTTENQVAKDYDWATDNRVITTGTRVPVESVTLDKTELEVGTGRSAILKATVKPDNATSKRVIFRSEDPTIASVDGSGKVTGVAVGQTRITVATVDGGKIASCVVKVVESASTGGDEEQEIRLIGKKNSEVIATLVFITNDADDVESFFTISKNGKKAKLTKMHKKGYDFKGWYLTYKDKKGKDRTKKISTLTAGALSKYSVDGALTLEARFSPIKYTIKYKVTRPAKKVKVKGRIRLSKAEKKILYKDGEKDGELTAKGAELSAKGYTLSGWTIVKNGTEVVIGIGETLPLSELVPEKGKTITLYPIWKAAEAE